MTTATDSDLQEIKEAILTLTKQVTELGKQVNDVEKNLTAKINDVEKNLTAKINDVEKNLTVKINDVEKNLTEVAGEVKLANTKIDGLDKRLSILETIYQRFFNVMLSFLGTGLAGLVLKFIWDNFNFVVPQ